MMPVMVTRMPKKPRSQAPIPASMPPPALMPMFQPMSATNKTLGPGADWAKAMEEENEKSVSQFFSSTK